MVEKNASARLFRRYYEGRPERIAELEQARRSLTLARKIHALRTEAGLTQRELAERVGTTPSVISRLESDDYEGHSIAMLRRIAAALGLELEVEFISPGEASRPAPREKLESREESEATGELPVRTG